MSDRDVIPMGELDPRIRIRAPLRCDGIGRLDWAEDTSSGGRLAVRWLPLEANGDAAAKACEKLPSHPTLPKIFQIGQVGTSAFVALDFPEGELLSARGEEPLDNELLLKLVAQLSDALATVHAQGVVHGEMSRDSVLLVPGGKASLWDMPLVVANRLSDRRGENRLMQKLVYTAPYLSPERARGEGASPAGDVYSLGAIACVSAGAPLPSAATTLGVVHLVAAGLWVPRVPSSLPKHWASILERMLAVDPGSRPSAAEVALAFARAPGQHALPTVPELPAVRLPPGILAAAGALMRVQSTANREALAPAESQAGPPAADPQNAISLSPPGASESPTTIQAPPAEPLIAAPVPRSVPLNESLSVSPELLADGAMSLSSDEVLAVRGGFQRRWMLMGAGVGLTVGLLAVVALSVSQPQVSEPTVEPAAAAVTPPAAEPVPLLAGPKTAAPQAPRPLDELSPLAKLASPRAAPKRASTPAAQPAAQPSPGPAAETDLNLSHALGQVPPGGEPRTAKTEPGPEGDEPPASELKRPNTEL